MKLCRWIGKYRDILLLTSEYTEVCASGNNSPTHSFICLISLGLSHPDIPKHTLATKRLLEIQLEKYVLNTFIFKGCDSVRIPIKLHREYHSTNKI